MNIGDYVRTEIGITKCIGIEFDKYHFDKEVYYDFGDGIYFLKQNEIKHIVIKSSPNIIELIEVGDIIRLKNFAGVYRVCDTSNGKIELDYQGELGAVIINNDSDIKSIVTKEQFKSMEYRIGDK